MAYVSVWGFEIPGWGAILSRNERRRSERGKWDFNYEANAVRHLQNPTWPVHENVAAVSLSRAVGVKRLTVILSFILQIVWNDSRTCNHPLGFTTSV